MNVPLAVNGTLMRGLSLNGNLVSVGATFDREATTIPSYRLWSIDDDRHPAMVRVSQGGAAIAVEVWQVPAAGLATILLSEPPGLAIGKVRLADGIDLGVLTARYGVDVWQRYGLELAPFIEEGLLRHAGNRLWLTRRGMLLANEVMAIFV